MTLKRFLQTVGAAGFMSLVLGFALAMPLTLHFNLPDRIEPVARYFCPETGTFAPRYFQARSARKSRYEACLDAEGKRIEDRATHYRIVQTIGFAWSAALLPLFFLIFRPLIAALPPFRRQRMATANRSIAVMNNPVIQRAAGAVDR
mgnify:CR=1 FL=1